MSRPELEPEELIELSRTTQPKVKGLAALVALVVAITLHIILKLMGN